MAKRSFSEFAEAPGDHPSSQKEFSTTVAISQLSERADDLIECLQALKSTKASDANLTQRLAILSRDLLPSFETLAKDEKPGRDTSKDQQPEVPVMSPWKPSDVSSELPPLPPVLDSSLETASFTHPGMDIKNGGRNYEQLEWLGDAYLYLMSTAYIYLTFPHLAHGEMCQIREVLVRNATLKEYSLRYGFDKLAVLPEEYGLIGRKGGTKASDKERAKVLGDIFEAHVAAIILSDPVKGVSRTASWMKALWSTTIPEQIKKRSWAGRAPTPLIAPTMVTSSTAGPSLQAQESQAKTPQTNSQAGAREKLNAELCLTHPRVKIDYRSLDGEGKPQKKDPLTNLPLFTQSAFLTGYGEPVKLGTGTGKRKADANENAAKHALENKKLLSIYREKKRVLMENRKAQEEASKDLDF